MNAYGFEFYDLLTRALGGNDSARLQGFIDEVMADKYNALQVDGFTFAPEMQLDFTFEQVMREVGLNVMANYYDLDSPAVPFANEGLDVYTGSIPRQKAVEYWNEDKYRKLLIAEQRFGGDADRVRNSAVDGLFKTLDSLVGGHTNQLTYQRNQMVSEGKVVINATNNPYGIAGVTISAHIPTANIKTLSGAKRWWTSVSDGIYSTEGASCDPIGDLQGMVRAARMKGVTGHFEVETSYLDQILEHGKVKEAIAAKFTLQSPVAVAAANLFVFDRASRIAALAAIIGAPIKAIDSLVAVESFNKTTKKVERRQFNAFSDNVLVFVPDGNIGEILTVEPLKIAGGTYGSFYDGRLLLTVGIDPVQKCQSFNTEMTSLVVPDKSNFMWYLHPYSA